MVIFAVWVWEAVGMAEEGAEEEVVDEEDVMGTRSSIEAIV
jgi:hypothetical protein